MSYIPPLGSSVPFNFSGAAYTPPAVLVAFDFRVVTSTTQFVSPGGIARAPFGVALVYNSRQRVEPFGIESSADFGLPVMSPRYVLMPGIDSSEFGIAYAELRNRTLGTEGADSFAAGNAYVFVKTQYLQLEGFSSMRMGFPTRTGYARTIRPFWGRLTPLEQPGVKYDTAGYGALEVTTRDRHLSPPSIDASVFGTMEVQNFNREVNPPSLIGAFGNLRIGPPPTLKPAGLAPGDFGQAFVSLFIRTLLVDSSEMDTLWGPTLGSGFFPMKVSLTYRKVTPAGFAANGFGLPRVSAFSNGLAPAGITGAIGAARIVARATVQPAGIDSAMFGLPKHPVQNQVEPHGDVMGGFGWPGLDFGSVLPSITPGDAGAPRVQRGVRVAGLAGVFGETTVVGESNCGSKLAVVARIQTSTSFGTPGVSR